MYWEALDRRLTVRHLRAVAKRRGCTGFYDMCKSKLCEFLRHHDAACLIQAAERRRRLIPQNTEDPITLADLASLSGPCFRYITATNHCIGYDAVALAQYVQQSGDFRDPVTRSPLSRDDLKRLRAQTGLPIEQKAASPRRESGDEEVSFAQLAVDCLFDDLHRVAARGESELLEFLVLEWAITLGAVAALTAESQDDARYLCGVIRHTMESPSTTELAPGTKRILRMIVVAALPVEASTDMYDLSIELVQ